MTAITNTTSAPVLVRFYFPTDPSPDASGRTLASILAYTDEELEQQHDYIQLIFPLPERSPFNAGAPVVDKGTFEAFRCSSATSRALRGQLQRSLQRLLEFYGFVYEPGEGIGLAETKTFEERFYRTWGRRFNHNHLRITRMLRSLRVLGCEGDAEAFHAALLEVQRLYPGVIGERSFVYWARAVRRPLWVLPDLDVVPKEGSGWLWEWEQQQARQALGEGLVETGGDRGGDE